MEAGISGTLHLTVNNCTSTIHEIRLTGELVQVMASGSPVTGVLTILAGNTTQVNFTFNNASVQHEVRVLSKLTSGGSYPIR